MTPPPVDHRASLLAGAAWCGSALAWWWGAAAPLAGACAAAAAAAVLHAAATRRRRGGRPAHTAGGREICEAHDAQPPVRARWLAAAITVMLALVSGGATASLARSGAAPDPAATSAVIRAQASVRSTAAQVEPGPDGAPRTRIALSLLQYRAGGRQWQSSLPVEAFASGVAWRELPVGAVIEVRGRLRAPGNGEATGLLAASGAPRIIEAPTGPAALADRARSGLASALTGADPDAASLVAGLAIGDESAQTPEFADAMRSSGLSHLTAVSGGNIAVVLGGILLLARSIRLRPWAQASAAGAGLCAYVMLVGPQPSVLRAAAMGAVGLTGILLGGARRGLPVLWACCLVLLLAAPALSVSLGFALSVVATAALIAAVPPVASAAVDVVGERMPRPVVLALVTTAAAQIATAPLLIAVGAPVSWVALPANLVAAALVAPITVLGLAAASLTVVLPGAAGVLAQTAALPAQLLAAIARWGGESAARPLPPTVPLALAVLIIAMVLRVRGGIAVQWLPHPAAPAVAVLGGLLLPSGGAPGDWRAAVCDVGQGTSVILRMGEAARVAVDVGPPGGGAVRCLASLGVSHLDAVVVTHFHADHIGGLAEVLSAVSCERIITTGFRRPGYGAAQVDAVAAEHGVPVSTVAAGDRFEAGDAQAVVLWPPRGFTGGDDDANDSSVVLRSVWPDGFAVLTTGDVEPPAQRRLMASNPPQSVDVALMPHHGSDHQDPRFADWLGAATAIASAGAGNNYGHPAPQTLDEYTAAGSLALRTDSDGGLAVSAADPGVGVERLG